jgi:hypothetical protein
MPPSAATQLSTRDPQQQIMQPPLRLLTNQALAAQRRQPPRRLINRAKGIIGRIINR